MKALFLIPPSVCAALLLASCGEGDDNPAAAAKPPVVAPELTLNQLADTPSALLRSQADSKVHWQQWNPELLAQAAAARRLIFVVIGSVRYPGTFETLHAIESRPDLVARLNRDFVPVLVDLDINRETSLVASALSAESRQSVSFPFMLLLSPQGNPVSWQPLPQQSDEIVQDFFENSIDVVVRLWKESADYVVTDSANKNRIRSENLPPPDPAVEDPEERHQAYRTAIRRLTSFFEKDLNTLSGSGGLFPVGTLECLATATHHPVCEESLRQRASESLQGIWESLEESAMIDPLDGGIYSARRGPSWQLPIFVRDCVTQARAIRSLCQVHQSGVGPNALETALRSATFAEAHYRTPGGLFAMASRPGSTPQEEWMWTVDDVKSVLDEEEFEVWKSMSELKQLGNLPLESDPRRSFFRLNSLSLRKSVDTVAEETGQSPDLVRTHIESGRKKLLKVRDDRFDQATSDPTPSATASFQMISAYAALHTATRDPAWRDKAVALGKACRDAFGAARFLNERPGEKPDPMSDGRGHAYAVAGQAALDLGAITLEDEWNLWAQDLATLLAENFITESGQLVETRPESRVIGITYSDRLMVFEESTAGLTRLNLSRLDALGFQTPPALQPWTVSLPRVADFPIVHTDSINALAHSLSHTRLGVGQEVARPLLDAVAALPLVRFERRMAREAGAKVEVMTIEGESRTLSTTAEIESLTSDLQ